MWTQLLEAVPTDATGTATATVAPAAQPAV